jgi:hypothetical protein
VFDTPRGINILDRLQAKATEAANLLLDKRQVHNVTKGASFGAQGKIKKYVGDLQASSGGKEHQLATSKACKASTTAHYDPPSGSVTKKKQ